MRRMTASILLTLAACQTAWAGGRLEIRDAWIRTAPPGAKMLAGYATLRNAGDAPLTVTAASSEAFGGVTLHETVEVDGVARMRALGEVEIAPGASVAFAPGGKHFMLMQPKGAVAAGSRVKIHVETKPGDGASADFVVRDGAP